MAEPDSAFEVSVKMVTVGDAGVGKSSLIVRYVRDEYEGGSQPTLAVEFLTKIVSSESGARVQVQLWDTAGSEIYRSVTRSYYRGCGAAMVVFDITRRSSFANVPRWLKDLNDASQATVVLVGNKSDLADNREVLLDEARGFAEGRCMEYFETSACTGEGVHEAFSRLIENAAKAAESLMPQKAVAPIGAGDVTQGEGGPKRGCC